MPKAANAPRECPEAIKPLLTVEKLKHLADQHRRFIKATVPGYIRPLFLQEPEQPQQRRQCSHCDGKGHIQSGKKRHYSEKYCPVAKRQKL